MTDEEISVERRKILDEVFSAFAVEFYNLHFHADKVGAGGAMVTFPELNSAFARVKAKFV